MFDIEKFCDHLDETITAAAKIASAHEAIARGGKDVPNAKDVKSLADKFESAKSSLHTDLQPLAELSTRLDYLAKEVGEKIGALEEFRKRLETKERRTQSYGG
jgi:ribosomal 50S subunit-associated protein YjgA (DUF615 family)